MKDEKILFTIWAVKSDRMLSLQFYMKSNHMLTQDTFIRMENYYHKCHILTYFPIFREINSCAHSKTIQLDSYHHKRHISTFPPILREIKSYAHSRPIYIENYYHKCHILTFFPIFRERVPPSKEAAAN